MKRPVLIGAIIAIIALVGAAAWVRSNSFKERGHSLGENLVRLRFLGQTIQRLAREKPNLFVEDLAGKSSDSVSELTLLEQFNAADYPYGAWAHDTWGRPLYFQILRSQGATNSLQYLMHLWSAGENKLNESGSGDDIALGPWVIDIDKAEITYGRQSANHQ